MKPEDFFKTKTTEESISSTHADFITSLRQDITTSYLDNSVSTRYFFLNKSFLPFLVLIFGFVAIPISYTVWSDTTHEDAVTLGSATIVSHEGMVRIKDAHGDWKTVDSTADLAVGDSISVENGSANIDFNDGNSSHLSNNTVVTIEEISDDSVILKQEEGTLYNIIGTDRPLNIILNGSTVSARDSIYETTKHNNQKSISVYKNSVLIENEKRLTLRAGESLNSNGDITKIEPDPITTQIELPTTSPSGISPETHEESPSDSPLEEVSSPVITVTETYTKPKYPEPDPIHYE
ncbi:FecR domain-containing protein [Candidatus Dojkabacteria bacterium]|uniref:FecR domain-containing protein n=1 Tax=Candidatus Dojkabacteria bacterium TaxID=2099670 RepID=A0A955L8G3_9BACT|nr:FecR domain-containing protein [Candidatus Dojkabacteria bacterium]